MHMTNIRYNAALRAFEATIHTQNSRFTTRVWGAITLPPGQVTSALTAKAARQIAGH